MLLSTNDNCRLNNNMLDNIAYVWISIYFTKSARSRCQSDSNDDSRILSANVDGFVCHGHLFGGRLTALFLLRIPHEHDERKHIDSEHQPCQVEIVAIPEFWLMRYVIRSIMFFFWRIIISCNNCVSVNAYAKCLRVIGAPRKRECKILLFIFKRVNQHLDDHKARGRCGNREIKKGDGTKMKSIVLDVMSVVLMTLHTGNEMNSTSEPLKHVPRIQKGVYRKYKSHYHHQQANNRKRCFSSNEI